MEESTTIRLTPVKLEFKTFQTISKDSVLDLLLKNEEASNFNHSFEVAKHYSNYYPKRNKEDILKKYDLTQFSSIRFPINNKKSVKNQIK